MDRSVVLCRLHVGSESSAPVAWTLDSCTTLLESGGRQPVRPGSVSSMSRLNAVKAPWQRVCIGGRSVLPRTVYWRIRGAPQGMLPPDLGSCREGALGFAVRIYSGRQETRGPPCRQRRHISIAKSECDLGTHMGKNRCAVRSHRSDIRIEIIFARIHLDTYTSHS